MADVSKKSTANNDIKSKEMDPYIAGTPFTFMYGLTLIQAWISNRMPC